MRILVVGATGLLGREIVQQLLEAGHGVRALVRRSSDAGKRNALARAGAEIVEGDLKDAASLAVACAGAHAVISTASSTFSRQPGDSIATVDRDGQLALVAAATRSDVGHFVFVSFRDDPAVQYPLGRAKRAVEAALGASGMTYTVLQASYFMEVWLTPALGFDPANGRVRLYGDGTRPISYVSSRDVARAAAASLSAPLATDAVVELGGPQPLSPREVVRMFEAAGAPEIVVESVSEEVLAAQFAAAVDPLEQSFAGLMLQSARGDAIDPGIGQRVFGFHMTAVRDHIASQLANTES